MTDPAAGHMIRVISVRHDGSPRDEWTARLLERCGTRLCLWVEAGGEEIVDGSRRQLIADSFVAIYWPDRWYNVWQFDRSEGIVYYANVAIPCSFDGDTLRWTDLDMDVVQFADGRTVVKDEDEFRKRSEGLNYPPDLLCSAFAARDELLRLAEARRFPFQRWSPSAPG